MANQTVVKKQVIEGLKREYINWTEIQERELEIQKLDAPKRLFLHMLDWYIAEKVKARIESDKEGVYNDVTSNYKDPGLLYKFTDMITACVDEAIKTGGISMSDSLKKLSKADVKLFKTIKADVARRQLLFTTDGNMTERESTCYYNEAFVIGLGLSQKESEIPFIWISGYMGASKGYKIRFKSSYDAAQADKPTKGATKVSAAKLTAIRIG